MKFKKAISGFMAAVMSVSLAGCVAPVDTSGTSANTSTAGGTAAPIDRTRSEETIQLTVYSQLANYSGKLTGWFAEVMKREFNVEMTIIPQTDGSFDTRMEQGNLGDIVVFGSDGKEYQSAVEKGMLYDWNDDELLTKYGAYIKENMTHALDKNMNLNGEVLAKADLGEDTYNELSDDEKKAAVDENKVLHGIGHNVATSSGDHEAFFYTWDIRWDLYKQLNYPSIKNLDDLFNVFVSMKEISPVDDNGNETYAVSLWPDWDGNMVMYVKSFATAYWGYDELGFGLYDVETGEYYDSRSTDGPYAKSLRFFNKLYRNRLLDPNSMTQTYDEMSAKVQASGTFFSIFNYSGSALYNSAENKEVGKYMYTLTPDDATPIAYGMNVMGGNRIWTIGSSSEYPEVCMEIINWLATPEGYMTYNYGPKDVCWYYDEDGNTCFTEFGEKANNDRKNTKMPDEWGGGTFNDGTFQANNTTWSKDASNPDSKGETYNADFWRSRRTDSEYAIEQDWRDFTGFYNSDEYLNSKPYKVALATSYTEGKRSSELDLIWNQVLQVIIRYSWQAIYASSEEECNQLIEEMIQVCKEYDPNDECLAWCQNEARIRKALEDEVRD